MKNSDEFCWVVKAENAVKEIISFTAELIIADQILVEKRLENLALNQKKKFSDQNEKEEKLIKLCRKHLEEERPLREMELNDEELKQLKTCQFLTMKPLIIAINIPEDEIKQSSIAQTLSAKFNYPMVQLSAGLEQEISLLNRSDRAEFMREMGIEEPALDKMSRLAFAGLGLVSFFTVGEDEVRAWPVRKGSSTPQAGSVIHSDIERGFVRAEMFTCSDLLAAGSEAKLKEQGKYYLKGKDYIVQDGDVLSFRFNV